MSKEKKQAKAEQAEQAPTTAPDEQPQGSAQDAPQPQAAEPAEQPQQQEDLKEAAKVAAAQMMDALQKCDAALKDLKEAEAKLEQAQDRNLRLQAEFDNYRKRTTAEKAAAREDGFADALRAMLPTIDNLERALSAARDAGNDSIVQGMEMVLKQFLETFSKKGLREIEALGAPFDPNLHAAVMQEPAETDAQRDTVAQVLQKGYLYGDRVLRYSTVKVYA